MERAVCGLYRGGGGKTLGLRGNRNSDGLNRSYLISTVTFLRINKFKLTLDHPFPIPGVSSDLSLR